MCILLSSVGVFVPQVFLVKEVRMGCLVLLVPREREASLEHQVNEGSQASLDLR